MKNFARVRVCLTLLAVVYLLGSALIIFSLTHRKVVNSNTVVYHTDASTPGPIGATGLQGLQGMQGLSIQGPTGAPGKDGITQVQYVPVTVQGPKGDVGAIGPVGPVGPVLEIRKDPVTGDLLQKYSTDSDWTVLLSKCDYLETGCTDDTATAN